MDRWDEHFISSSLQESKMLSTSTELVRWILMGVHGIFEACNKIICVCVCVCVCVCMCVCVCVHAPG